MKEKDTEDFTQRHKGTKITKREEGVFVRYLIVVTPDAAPPIS